MNKEAVEVLNKITSKEVEALTPMDIAFLRARRSYLTAEQEKQYESVLEINKKEEKTEQKDFYMTLKHKAIGLGIDITKLAKGNDALKQAIAEKELENTHTFPPQA